MRSLLIFVDCVKKLGCTHGFWTIFCWRIHCINPKPRTLNLWTHTKYAINHWRANQFSLYSRLDKACRILRSEVFAGLNGIVRLHRTNILYFRVRIFRRTVFKDPENFPRRGLRKRIKNSGYRIQKTTYPITKSVDITDVSYYDSVEVTIVITADTILFWIAVNFLNL